MSVAEDLSRNTDNTASESTASAWNIDKSGELYRVSQWGHPYFSINAQGHVMVSPRGDNGSSIDLYELLLSLRKRNLELPLVVHFPDILRDRMERLQSAFSRAIAKYGYKGVYRGVFPVKCNNQRHFVKSLVEYGRDLQFGLEAGSKPELLIALSCLDTPGALLICNGYKDEAYLETAMLASRLGKQVVIVLEQLDEVILAVKVAKKLGIKPLFGLRVKLSAISKGHWGSTVGTRAKFGLSIIDVNEAVDILRANDMLDSLRLLHFHMGSQISSIANIKNALKEAGCIYVSLVKMGAPMGYLDVGGGLAVDYDGSRSDFYASKNYNTQSYANDVVAEINDCCTLAKVDVPTIISESGRALSSHQAVLLFDVLGEGKITFGAIQPPDDDTPHILRVLYEIYSEISEDNYQEAFHDAVHYKKEASEAFQYGLLTLEQRAQADCLYWASCKRIQEIARHLPDVPEDIGELDNLFASIYYINLSVFRSAPDHWAIDQLLPIMPIHRLGEEPTVRATMADLTCDSDGKIDRFIAKKEDTCSLLEVHPLQYDKAAEGNGLVGRGEHQPYYLGMFLCGAYQEIMGNLHNLFGETNAVYIELNPMGYSVKHIVRGETVGEVLQDVQYEADSLLENLRQQCEAALLQGTIDLDKSQHLLNNFERVLGKYTYLTIE